MKTVEQYMEHLKTLDEAYQWPIKTFESGDSKRAKIHEEFSYVVTYEGHYGHLDTMDDWCRKRFGDMHGLCQWRECEFSFNAWYTKNKFDEKMDKKIDENAGPRPSEKKKRAWNKWQKITDKIVEAHFAIIEERTDAPKEHSHKGIWTTNFLVKTGYDYGYCDYCFKNPEDAFYFKIIWDGEQK